MYDSELNEWRKLLQKARRIHRKIQNTTAQEERDRLINEHKATLEEARKRYNEIYKTQRPGEIKNI